MAVSCVKTSDIYLTELFDFRDFNPNCALLFTSEHHNQKVDYDRALVACPLTNKLRKSSNDVTATKTPACRASPFWLYTKMTYLCQYRTTWNKSVFFPFNNVTRLVDHYLIIVFCNAAMATRIFLTLVSLRLLQISFQSLNVLWSDWHWLI